MSLNVYTANDDDDDGEGDGEDDNDDRSGVLLPIHQSPWSSPPPHAFFRGIAAAGLRWFRTFDARNFKFQNLRSEFKFNEGN